MTQSTPFRALVIDDDKAMRQSLGDLLQAAGWETHTIARAAQAEENITSFQPDVILSDVRMPGMTGLDLLAALDKAFAPPLVLISAHGDIQTAVAAMQAGAYSFLEKPYDPRRLLTVLSHAAEQHRMRQANAQLTERLMRLSGLDKVMLGVSDDIAQLRQTILDLAEIDAAVLITGETGTGKELVAQALHDLGLQSDAPFVAVNCASLSAETFEAQMFGVAGDTPGRLAMASGGTLFLDEICACPLPVQAKLLRVIEDKQIFPVGAAAPVPLEFKLISSTNADVQAAVADGRLRSDLLFRINTMVLSLPPLRNRPDDIPLLMTHFMGEFARAHDVATPDLTPDDLAALLAHDWPGNVRELRSVAERRVIAARLGGGSVVQAMMGEQPEDGVPATLRNAVATFEREMIGKAIRTHGGRMDAAAAALGIGRRTLNEKIVKLGLDKTAWL